MRLSEAIRLGSMLKPQAFGTLEGTRRSGWFRKAEQTTCAMGAAFEASGCGHRVGPVEGPLLRGQSLPGETVIIMDTPLEWIPILTQPVPCPISCGWNSDLTVRMITHLNDEHRWTRERIAEWVEGVEATMPVETAAEVAQAK